MQNATEIYGKQVRQLPSAERLRLAALILEDLTAEQTESVEKPKQFRVRARVLGLRPGLNLDNTAELLEIVEGADYK
jgi:hypothetical protein